jgi:hypothetical protein
MNKNLLIAAAFILALSMHNELITKQVLRKQKQRRWSNKTCGDINDDRPCGNSNDAVLPIDGFKQISLELSFVSAFFCLIQP